MSRNIKIGLNVKPKMSPETIFIYRQHIEQRRFVLAFYKVIPLPEDNNN